MPDLVIIVLAGKHPDRDEWVDEQAHAQAAQNDVDLGPYQETVRIPPDGTVVHAFGDAAMVNAIRGRWEDADGS